MGGGGGHVFPLLRGPCKIYLFSSNQESCLFHCHRNLQQTNFHKRRQWTGIWDNFHQRASFQLQEKLGIKTLSEHEQAYLLYTGNSAITKPDESSSQFLIATTTTSLI